MDRASIEAIRSAIAGAVERGEIPGAAALVNWNGRDVFRESFGFACVEPERVPMRADHRFDLASLTKVVATTTAILILRDDGALDLDDPVANFLPELRPAAGKQQITIRHCLTHTSGLPPFRKYYNDIAGRPAYLRAIATDPLQYATGAGRVYSDLGFILLGFVVEAIAGESLADFARRRIFAPLGMKTAGYIPVPSADRSPHVFAATEFRAFKNQLMIGEVHDENAYALGGVSGHAGLFATVDDLSRFGRMLLGKGELDGVRILAPESVALLNRHQLPEIDLEAGLGWRIRPRAESKLGFLASPRSFGHTGFTGTTLWLDPDNRVVAALLTNAVHPSREKANTGPVRLAFHQIVANATRRQQSRTGVPPVSEERRTGVPPVSEERRTGVSPVDSSSFSDLRQAGRLSYLDGAAQPAVRTGLDILERENFKRLHGRRVAIVTNHTAINANREHIVDLLARFPGVKVTALFGPEHGIRGAAGAGEKVGDSAQGGAIPVYSLYGERRKPTPEMARDFDVVVYDIQDVGARFYTYIWTMFTVQQFCAENGKPLIVLDRPNPIGGHIIDGPVLDESAATFVGLKPIPIRYGLTPGELAILFNQTGWLGDGLRAELDVVALEGWTREMWFDETGLPWLAPSPAMPTLDTATAYTGTCFLESTGWSEGRGTQIPFEVAGGPDVNPDDLARRLNAFNLPGCTFLPTRFTPRFVTGSIAPKHLGQPCGGVFLRVDDRERFRAVRAGLAIVMALRDAYPDVHKCVPGRFDRLLGTPTVRAQIESGVPLDVIAAAWTDGLAAFDALRKTAMLYTW